MPIARGVITPNQIPWTTIVTYLQKSYRSRISNNWATIPACSVVPPIYSSRKHTVTYHFSDLREVYSGNSIRSWCDGSSDRSSMEDPLSYLSFQPVLHDWCNKGRGMCYPVCGMVHIKEPLLLIEKNSLCGSSGFPLSLSEWSFIICPTPYNRK